VNLYTAHKSLHVAASSKHQTQQSWQ